MWVLTGPNENIIYLKPNSITNVGRKSGEIILANDGSVSKKHAILIVNSQLQTQTQISQNTPTSVLIVKDTNSKYGSSIMISGNENNTKKVTPEGCILNHSDKIRFGLQYNIFTVTYIPFITVVSKLTNYDYQKLVSIMKHIDGVIIHTWDLRCSHLTTSEAILSDKVVNALLSAKAIVDLRYWEAILNAIENNQTLPQFAEFALKFKEQTTNSDVLLTPNLKRQSLFINYIFVFFSSTQFNNYSKIISAAGGKSVEYYETDNKIDPCADNVIVLQLTTNETHYADSIVKKYKVTEQELKDKNRRLISESEIPLAILHCSTERYCNPLYSFTKLFSVPSKNIMMKNSAVIAADTQAVEAEADMNTVRSLCVIKDTYDTSADCSVPSTSQQRNLLTENAILDAKKHECHIISETIESLDSLPKSNESIGTLTENFSQCHAQLSIQKGHDTGNSLSKKRQRSEEDNNFTSKKLCLQNLSLNNQHQSSRVPKENENSSLKNTPCTMDEWGFVNVNEVSNIEFEDMFGSKNEYDNKNENNTTSKTFQIEKLKVDRKTNEHSWTDVNNLSAVSNIKGKMKNVDNNNFESIFPQINENQKKSSDSMIKCEKKKFSEKRERLVDDKSYENNSAKKTKLVFQSENKKNEKTNACNISYSSCEKKKSEKQNCISFHSKIMKYKNNTVSILRRMDDSAECRPFGKTFKKIYTNIPSKRLTFSTTN